MPEIIYLRPSDIRFSQSSISCKFDNGTNIGELLEDILVGRCFVSGMPKISVVKQKNAWVTFDNRRLWIFKHLESVGRCETVAVKVRTKLPPGRNTTQTQGKTIKIRGQVVTRSGADVSSLIVKKGATTGKQSKDAAANNGAESANVENKQVVPKKRRRKRQRRRKIVDNCTTNDDLCAVDVIVPQENYEHDSGSEGEDVGDFIDIQARPQDGQTTLEALKENYWYSEPSYDYIRDFYQDQDLGNLHSLSDDSSGDLNDTTVLNELDESPYFNSPEDFDDVRQLDEQYANPENIYRKSNPSLYLPYSEYTIRRYNADTYGKSRETSEERDVSLSLPSYQNTRSFNDFKCPCGTCRSRETFNSGTPNGSRLQ